MTVHSTVRVCYLVRDCQSSTFPTSRGKISCFPALRPASGSAAKAIHVLTRVYTEISRSLFLSFLVLTQACFHIFLFDVCVFFSEASVECLWSIFPSGNNLRLRSKGSLHLWDISCLLEVLLRTSPFNLLPFPYSPDRLSEQKFLFLFPRCQGRILSPGAQQTVHCWGTPHPKHFPFNCAKLGGYFIEFWCHV